MAVPPATAQRLEQRCAVAVAHGLGLDPGEHGVLVGLLRREQVYISHCTQAVLRLHQRKAGLGRAFCDHLLLECLGIGLQRPEHVGHILERSNHRTAVLRRRLVIRRHRRPLAVFKRTGIEQRLGDGPGQAPHARACGKQLAATGHRGTQ